MRGKILFFMMISKLVGNIFVIYMHIKKYSKRFFLIVTYLLISTNSFALDQIKSGVKMLDLSSVPDTVVFFDDKGEKYSLDNFEGKTILLVFWATWCASCIKEMPDLDVLQKDFRKLPFAIIPVSQDYQGIEIIQKYYKDYDIRYLPIYHDFKNQLFKAFSIVGLPTAILINPDGKMLVSFIGTINWYDEEIRNIILSNIPGNHPEPKNSYREQTLNQPVNKQLKAEEQENKDEKPKIQQNNEENNASKNDNKE
ncbi:MAG: TlpA disulfide reductase family protein [Rickettsia endosymbiont of Sergentomyia squamirostris]|uniref:TlpA disulfide reductase family protein n=1 Tax=Candidatus Tisiphia endosymbiont of Sergentomyia squamirostris TaxID=3113639 RepID=A0AAT9G924_9RICK